MWPHNASGSRTRSCLRPRKAGRSQPLTGETPFRGARTRSAPILGPRLALVAEPPAGPLHGRPRFPKRFHARRSLHLRMSCPLESPNVSGADRLSPVSIVPSSFGHGSRTKAPSLHRRYPASPVLRASPPPRRPRLALTGSRLTRATPPAGLPVLLPSPSCPQATATTPAEPVGACVARFPTAASLPRISGGSASALPQIIHHTNIKWESVPAMSSRIRGLRDTHRKRSRAAVGETLSWFSTPP